MAATLTAARAKGLAAPPKLSGLAGGGASAPDGSPVLAGLRRAHNDVHTALHRALDPHLAVLAREARQMMARAKKRLPGGAAALARPRVAHDLGLTAEELGTLCSVLCVRVVQLAQRASGLRSAAAALPSVPLEGLREALGVAEHELEDLGALAGTVEREFAAVRSASHALLQLLDPRTSDSLVRARAYYEGTALPRFTAAAAASEAALAAAEARLQGSGQFSWLFKAAAAALQPGAGAGAGAQAEAVQEAGPVDARTGASLPRRQGSLLAVRFTPTDAALEASRAASELVRDVAELAEQHRVLFGEVQQQEQRVEAIHLEVQGAGAAAERGVQELQSAELLVARARCRTAALLASACTALLVALLVLELKYNLLRK